MELGNLTVAKVQSGLASKDWSCRDLAEAALAQAKTSDKKLGAFLRFRDAIVEEAEAADQRLASGGPMRPLEGVVVGLKDNLMLHGEVTTAASKILEDYKAVYTATSVQKLLDAGALVLGKTNLDEFAMGASTENSALGTTRNPWNTDYVPGGSSGGSAVAVASGQVVASLGSDTGGSIRQPAAFCNVVGLKPTYGRVSRYGVVALASSLDQIGPFARTAEDAARLYSVISGQDDNDRTSQDQPVGDVLKEMSQPLKGLRIGLPDEMFGEGVDPKLADVVKLAAKEFEKLGASIHPVSLPHAQHGLATYYILQPAEASSNLARYDGIRYPLSVRDGQSLQDIYTHTRAKGFGAETKRRIMLGTFVLSSGYVDAYYHHANRVRQVMTEEFQRTFDTVDLLLAPTTPTTAFPLGAKTQDPLTMYLADLLTVPANLAGIPAMSVPAGFIDGLPVGIQLMAKSWNEATIFRAAAAYQGVTDWHTRRPPPA